MSSVRGPTIRGKRSRRRAMIALVSSTASVVWVMLFDPIGVIGPRAQSTSASFSTSTIRFRCLPHRASRPPRARRGRRARRVALLGEAHGLAVDLGDERTGCVDRAQATLAAGAHARGACRGRRTRTRLPPGPRSARRRRSPPALRSCSTTYLLCTISLRTYTGQPWISSARSTVCTARSTPAQYPRGAASGSFSTVLTTNAIVGAPGTLGSRAATPSR